MFGTILVRNREILREGHCEEYNQSILWYGLLVLPFKPFEGSSHWFISHSDYDQTVLLHDQNVYTYFSSEASYLLWQVAEEGTEECCLRAKPAAPLLSMVLESPGADPRAYDSSPSPPHAALAQFTPFSGRFARAGALLSDLDSIMSHSPITPEDGPAVLESGPHVKQYVQQLMALGAAAQASRSVQASLCVSLSMQASLCRSLSVQACLCLRGLSGSQTEQSSTELR